METKNRTDEELVCAAQNGDNDAVTELLYRFKDKVKALSRSFFLVGADYDDLIQEGMIGLYRAIKEYSPERSASFKTFALICIKARFQDAIKSANRKKHKFLNDYISLYSPAYDDEDDRGGEFIESVKSDEFDPEQKILRDETSETFYKNLADVLNGQEQKILRLFLKGLSYENIAKEVGVTSKKVDNTLVKIRREINKIL